MISVRIEGLRADLDEARAQAQGRSSELEAQWSRYTQVIHPLLCIGYNSLVERENRAKSHHSLH